MNNNRKTHVYINKFAKATINTYSKKNSILTSKHTKKNLQVSLNFNIARTKVMKNPLMTSTIYSVTYRIKKKKKNSFSNSKEEETKKKKKEKKRTQASKKYIIACQQLRVIYFSFSFI